MNILLLGKTGQVGFELHRTLAPIGTINAPARDELNLMDERAVDSYLSYIKPDIVVNAAAWTAVDAAEEQQKQAWRLNAGLPEQLALFTKKQGIRLVHFSSDYVYPGAGVISWKENSPVDPVNLYGKTKLTGDQAIEKSGTDYLIFRTSWVYSSRGNNFMKTMLRLAESKDELSIVADQVGAPTPARLIAQVTTLAIYCQLASGLYNLAPKGEVSWCDFAIEIFKRTEQAGKHLILATEKVHSIPTSDYPTPARRPLNSRMDVTKLEKSLNIKLPDWQSQLAVTLTEYLETK